MQKISVLLIVFILSLQCGHQQSNPSSTQKVTLHTSSGMSAHLPSWRHQSEKVDVHATVGRHQPQQVAAE